jgi:hypothetical protein
MANPILVSGGGVLLAAALLDRARARGHALGADGPRLRRKLARARKAEPIAAWRTRVAQGGASTRSERAGTP